jgi:hypothetical protein
MAAYQSIDTSVEDNYTEPNDGNHGSDRSNAKFTPSHVMLAPTCSDIWLINAGMPSLDGWILNQ